MLQALFLSMPLADCLHPTYRRLHGSSGAIAINELSKDIGLPLRSSCSNNYLSLRFKPTIFSLRLACLPTPMAYDLSSRMGSSRWPHTTPSFPHCSSNNRKQGGMS
jgi:hypothetical protein